MALARNLQIVYTDPNQEVKEFNISNINPTMTKTVIQNCVTAITGLWRNTFVATYITQKVDLNDLN